MNLHQMIRLLMRLTRMFARHQRNAGRKDHVGR